MKIFYIKKDGEIKKEIWDIVFDGEYHIIVIYAGVPDSELYNFSIVVAPAVDKALQIKEAFTQFENLPSGEAWHPSPWKGMLRWDFQSTLEELRDNLQTALGDCEECGDIPDQSPDK